MAAAAEDLTEIFVALENERSSTLGCRLGTRRNRLDILEHPGECLFELTMPNQSFAASPIQTLTLLRTPPRRMRGGTAKSDD